MKLSFECRCGLQRQSMMSLDRQLCIESASKLLKEKDCCFIPREEVLLVTLSF